MRTPRFVSLGTKLAALTMGIVVVVSAFVYLELTSRERQSLVRSKVSASASVADLLAAALVAPLDFRDTESIESELRYLRTNPDVGYAVVRPTSGAAIVESGERPPTDAGFDVEAGGNAEHVRADRVVVTRSIHGPRGKLLGTAAIHFSLAPENAAFEASRLRILILSVGFALVVGALLIVSAQRLIVSPLSRLVRAAQRLEVGKAARVEIGANDEIGQLASAFNDAAAAIVDREERLASARAGLQELFDHLRQGVLVFGKGGGVEGTASRQALTIFAGAAEEAAATLEGRDVRELLYGGSLQDSVDALAFAEWLDAAFEMPASSWNEVAELAPPEVTREAPDGQSRVLALEFRPIVAEDRVARVMLLVSDETERRRLERAIESSEKEHARQIRAMRRLLAGGAGTFAQFLEGLPVRIAAWRRTADGDEGAAVVEELSRLAHTMKGEARTLELKELEAEVALLEDLVSELAGRLRRAESGARLSTAEVSRLRDAIEQVAGAASRSRELFIEASPIGVAALDQLVVRRSDVERLSELTKGAQGDVGHLVRGLLSRPFGELAEPLREQAPFWAEAEDKRVEVSVIGKEISIEADHCDIVRAVITHLVRNAVAHGVELPEIRHRANKHIVGSIRLECRREAGSVVVVVEDDGAGFDSEALAARASALGVDPGSDATKLAFVHGLSTAKEVGELAGRGVGLSAVAADLRSIRWSVDVTSERGKGSRVVIAARRRNGVPQATQAP